MLQKPLVAVLVAALLPFAAAAYAQSGPSKTGLNKAGLNKTGPYKIIKTAKVGGEGGFDYITADPANRTLYIDRSGDRSSGQPGHLVVYNLDTLAQVGNIPDVSGHGAEVDDASGHGFATSNPVTMFNAKTFAVIKKIAVQGSPDGFLNDTYNHHFYVLSHREPNLTVLDDKTGAILGTINVGGAVEQTVSDGHGHIYVDVEDKAKIAIIDANTMKMTGSYDLSSKSGGCAGLAIDAKHNILFAACRDKNDMVILSATDGHIIADLPIGKGCDGAVFNPATMEVFSTQGDGTLTVIKEDSPTHFHVEQTVATPVGAKCITLDTRTNHLYTDAAQWGPAPAAASESRYRRRGPVVPGSFSIIVVGK